MQILRVYNNNVVLAADAAGQESVLIGRGLAFGKKKGEAVDPAQAEQTFLPERAGTAHLHALLAELPPEVLALATELEGLAAKDFGLEISHSLVLPLADHLAFAVERARQATAVDYPLGYEVARLYPRETAFGRRALELVRERLGVQLPPEEAVPVALHVVNAQFSAADLSRTFRMTEIFGQIFRIISSSYGREVDRASMSASRFVTHLRYLFVRAEQERARQGEARARSGGRAAAGLALAGVGEAMRRDHPRAHACADKVVMVLQMHLGEELSADEHTYLAIHIARLAADLWGAEAEPAR